MKLISEAIIREALQFDDMSNLSDAIVSALKLATVNLASDLRVKDFARTAIEDIFFLGPGIRQADGLYRFRCALSRGFLVANPTVAYAATVDGFDDSTAITSFKCNLEKGELNVFGSIDLTNRYLRATYNAGFAVDAEDTELYAAVPDWLQQGAKSAAIGNLMETNPELRGGGGEDGAPMRSPRYLKQSANAAVVAHIRYFASAIHPLA